MFVDFFATKSAKRCAQAIDPEHGETSKALIRSADLALYASKRKGRGYATIFNQELDESNRIESEQSRAEQRSA